MMDPEPIAGADKAFAQATSSSWERISKDLQKVCENGSLLDDIDSSESLCFKTV
jgi:hypothetical protein